MPRAVLLWLLPLASFSAYDSSWYGSTARPPSSTAFRSVSDFGAIGDGVADDSAAIQAAMNAARGAAGPKAPAIVYLPPGDYLVSQTIIMWAFTTLRGCSTSRPTIRLAPGAAGFGNRSALRPMIATTSGYDVNTTAGMPPWTDNTLPSNFLFYTQLHSLNLDVSAPGNEGAVALYWCVAQQTSVRAVDITVGGAFSGIDICQVDGYAVTPGGGAGGGGSVEDVAVSGGAHSLRATASQYAFRGLRLTGARASAIALQSQLWVFAFVDLLCADTPALLTTRGMEDAHSTSVSIIDAVLRNVSGPAALLLNGRGTPTFLQNVTLLAPLPAAIVANSTGGGGGAVDRVWLPVGDAAVERWSGWFGGDELVGNFVSGERLAAAAAALPGSPRRALASQPRPFFDDLPAPPCNALADCGAAGDNATDDTAALQRCLDRCPAVFLPFGIYRVRDTLNLSACAVLVGEMLSNIFLEAAAPGFGSARAPRPVLDTPDDHGAAVRIADVSLAAGAGNAGATMLRWRAGGDGGLWDVNVNISHPIYAGIQATGQGGGFLSNVHIWGADHSWWSNDAMPIDRAEYGLLSDAAGPLTAYSLISEHHRLSMVRITGAARNHDLVVTQTEQYQYKGPTDANETVHILLDGGASNVTVYGALVCNWWMPQVLRLIAADGVGPNVSLFGLKGVGSATGLMNQPSSPGICPNGSRADPPFYGLPADVNVPQR